MAITFDGFSLQDSNYISQDVTYRNIPDRELDAQKISRRPGVKLLSSEFGAREVTIKGSIIGSSASDLQEKIDNLHLNVTRKEIGLLSIESGRSGDAIVSSVTIADPHYALDYVPFEVQFLMPDPFWYGEQQTVDWDVTAGVFSVEKTITISGTYYAEPLVKYFAPSGAGITTTSGIVVSYAPTAETITWSGVGLAEGSSVTFDYINHLILEGSTQSDVEGVFSRWNPGTANFTVTFSGTANGGSLEFSYQPRYL
jgi:hypothetical protein